MSARGKSPFHQRAAVTDPAHFFGRAREIRSVLARTAESSKPQCVSVVGSRRIGKSSLLRQLSDVHGPATSTPDQPYVTVYHDLEGSAGLTVDRFFRTLLRRLDKQVAKACEGRPWAEPRETSGGLSNSGEGRGEEAFCDRVEDLSDEGVRIVLHLDEFDAVTLNPAFDADFFGRLRYLASSFQLAYVTSSFGELTELCHQQEIRQSPFFNVFSTLGLGLLTPPEADELLATEAARAGSALSAAERELIDELAGTHPFFLQLAANAAWECERTGDAVAVRKAFLEDAAPHFRYAFAHLSSDRARVLASVAEGPPSLELEGPDVEHLLRRGLVARGAVGLRPFSAEFGRWVVERAASDEGRAHLARSSQPTRQVTPRSAAEPEQQVTAEVVRLSRVGSVLEERYHLVRELGRGGFGLVFEAVDELLQRKVAIKVLRPDRTRGPRADKHRERFLGEARHAARINHRNVIAIHDVGEVEDEWYFVMELFEGRSVRELLEERGALPVREALGIVLQAAAGLDAAHALEIVHRDVKPENVLVGADGHVKLVDFGLALFLAEMRTTTDGVVLMTPRYCAPEQVLGDPLGPRTDVFALGCVLFEMLTGRHAFAGESASNVLYTIVNMTPPPRPPDLAPLREDLDAIVRRCLAREPGDRYASCAALARDVEAALARD